MKHFRRCCAYSRQPDAGDHYSGNRCAGRLHAAHGAPHLRRKTRHDLFQSGCDRGGFPQKKTFENAYCRIEHGVMLPEKADEVRTSVVGVNSRARSATLVKRSRLRSPSLPEQKVEHDEIECWISSAPPSTNCRADITRARVRLRAIPVHAHDRR